MKYYAHSKKGAIPAQTYMEHIENVMAKALGHASTAGKYAALDGAGALLRSIVHSAAAYHDLGKLDRENQAVLAGDNHSARLKLKHADAGAAHFLSKEYSSPFSAVIIGSHHRGLPDFVTESQKGILAFREEEICSIVDEKLPEYEAIHHSLFAPMMSLSKEACKGDLSVFLRLALSCLADADHEDTATHYGMCTPSSSIELRAKERLEQLDKYVSGLKGNDERSALRAQMYEACRNAGVEAAIVSCDGPVGTGKTLALMAHLLVQVILRKLRRIIVVLPYTNIIQQSVDVYRKALTLPGESAEEVVAELHHRADCGSLDARYLTALWRAPIIVTTAVAFFEILASKTPSTLRRLHELPGSALFIDESHAALPAKLLPLAWRWINIYAREWKCYWLLASGSLCRFWEIGDLKLEEKPHVPEIVQDELREKLLAYENNRIVYKADLSPKTLDELVRWIADFPGPRLIILNTVQNAAVVANRVSEAFGRKKVEHLSSALTPTDRSKTLARVKARLKDRKDADWTLVATSCVEAGVDLSFRTGFREIASAISLFQTAGRIARNGEYADCAIWSFCLADCEEFSKNPAFMESAKVLKKHFNAGKDICPSQSTDFIKKEIVEGGLSATCKTLVDDEKIKQFKKVEKAFNVIEESGFTAVVSDTMAEALLHEDIDWKELQRNSVQISQKHIDTYSIPAIIDKIYHWNRSYDDFLGYMAGIVPSSDSPDGLILR